MPKLQTKFLDLSDIRIAYCENGSGTNLLLLHGNSGSKSIFKLYQDKYFSNFHTYALDSRGHGESISIDSKYSINQYSDDVIRFCENLGIKKAYIIGYSDGGNISLFLAKKRPDIFERIIAISPNYLVSGTTDKSLKLLRRIYSIFTFLKKLGVDTTKMILKWDLMLNDIGLSDDDLKAIRANIHILYAQNDMIKEDHILSIGNLIPNTTTEKINNCSHISILNKQNTIASIKSILSR
jgi:pimeloyl-ACP methyl ester carboxylesterase